MEVYKNHKVVDSVYLPRMTKNVRIFQDRRIKFAQTRGFLPATEKESKIKETYRPSCECFKFKVGGWRDSTRGTL